MTSINAYYDGHGYVTEGNVVAKQNQRVIITFLDDFVPEREKKSLEDIKKYMNGSSKSVPDGISTLEYIRQLHED